MQVDGAGWVRRTDGPDAVYEAVAAHAAALAGDRVSFNTAPIKDLVSEKFFGLCEIFGGR